MKRFLLNGSLWGLAAIALFPLVVAEAAITPVRLSSGDVGTSVWDTDNTTVGVSMQIVNAGTAQAEDVMVTSVALSAGTFQGPQALPLAIGPIEASSDTILNLIVKVPASNGTSYLMTVNGTYRYTGQVYGYSINRSIAPGPSPTSFPVSHGVSVVQNPKRGGLSPEAACPRLRAER